jgi:hypothetical protein
VPHPRSPASRLFDWSALPRIDIGERVRAVADAIDVGRKHPPSAIVEATGAEAVAILEGLLPGLLMCLCVVAATTAVGAAVGAAIGALAFGVGAAPGAALGASGGFEAGLALLEGLGIAFLAATVGASVGEAATLSKRAFREAWDSVESRNPRLHVDHAGRTFAAAAGALMRGVLQGIVAFLLAKGANSASARVPELVAKLRASRLGEGFATWVERNWTSLIDNPRLKQRVTSEVESGGGGGGSTSARSARESGSAAGTSNRVRSQQIEPSNVPGRPSFDETYAKAPAAKQEIDGVADEIASRHGGAVAKAPIKSRARALEKIENDYDGDPSKIKDLARNTIVVRSDRVNAVADELAARGASVKRIDASSNPMGYSGVNAE